MHPETALSCTRAQKSNGKSEPLRDLKLDRWPGVPITEGLAKINMEESFKPPKPDVCKTRHFYDDFWECQIDHADVPFYCPYALGFGFKYFCKHPDCRDFALSDRASEKK